MNEFEFDELIEASNYQDFRVSHCVYFIADLSNSNQQLRIDKPIMTLNKSGSTAAFRFARKIEPMAVGWINGHCYKAKGYLWDELEALEAKIMAGDVCEI
tara:strand:+ start:349 stop:648 length:300 start_codon:yes stop_codon:yes gene_type:complete